MQKKYPEGFFIAVGIAFGMLFGIPLAMSLGNYGFVGAGIPIGLAIGMALEEKFKKKGRIRPLTKKEKDQRKIAFMAGVALLALGLIVFVAMLLR